MRIGVIGARASNDSDMIKNVLNQFVSEYICIVGGGSKGAERIAMEWAKENGIDYILFKPFNFIDQTLEHNTKFFTLRNKQIIDNSDYVIIFADDSEGGVKKIIEYVKFGTKKSYQIISKEGEVSDVRVNAA